MKSNELFVLILFITSCTSVQKNDVPFQNNVNISSSTFKTLDTSLSFSGFWVNEQYVTSIKKTKSPTGTEIPEASCISIPVKTLTVTRMVYGFHEGGEDLVFVKIGKEYEVWDACLENKRYDVTIQSSNMLSIGDNHFVKIQYVEDEKKDVRQPAILEELLFAGRYQDDKGSIVEFTNDGQLNGLGEYKTYSAYIDYSDQGMDVDQIALGVTKAGEENYAFKFNNDTLSIFKLKCLDFDSLNNVCAVVDFGALQYRLVKKDRH